ncbi:MAG: hypothetical protein ACLGIN_13495 [Candidatus Sericytochromatia bacterium]
MRRYAEALAEADPVTRAGQVEGLGNLSLQDFLEAISARHAALMQQLPDFSADPQVWRDVAAAIEVYAVALRARAFEAEEKAARARMSKLVHDIRSPLGAIFGALNMLEHREAQPMLKLVERGAEQLLALTETLQPGPTVALVLEPDAGIREVIAIYLRQEGYRVVALGQAAEAAKLPPPSVALVEAGQLREALATLAPQGVPLVLLGGAGPGGDAMGWLPKPFKKAELIEAVRRATSTRGAQAEGR